MKNTRLLKALGEVDSEFIEEAYIDEKTAGKYMRRLLTAAGIAIAAALSAAVLLRNTAEIPVDQPEAPTDTSLSQTSEPAVVTEPTDASANAADTTSAPDGGITEEKFDFNNVEITEEPKTGIPMSYEELQDFLAIYAGKINFVRFEIIERYSAQEAAIVLEEQGFGSKQGVLFDPELQTLCRARIDRDYLSGREEDIEIYILRAGGETIQPANEPPYKAGDKYAALFMDLNYGSVNTPLPDLSFACIEKDGREYLYKLCGSEEDNVRLFSEDGRELGEEPDADEMYRYTSTSNNPERFSRKFAEEELTAFLRAEWEKRGYGFPDLDSKVFYGTGYEYTDDGDVMPLI